MSGGQTMLEASLAKPEQMTAEEIDALPLSYLGPTWKRNEDGGWLLPERTLGWQVIAWCTDYLNHFDGTPHIRFTNEQVRFLLWWYAVDKQGRFIYRKGVLQRSKGWGKDPLLAVISLVEFVGPSRFAGWDANGDPVGEREKNAWVQIVAVNQAQTRNTTTLLPVLMSEQLIAAHGIKPGVELIRAHSGRCRIEAVTSSHRAVEGGRATFTLLNEIQHWVQGNKGKLMYTTIAQNAAKVDGRFLAITNAYMPGEDSVGEQMRAMWNAIAEGRAEDTGFLYDSVEAHPATPLTREALTIVVPKVYGDATWVNLDSIVSSALDLTIEPARSRRMYYNQITADEDALFQEKSWVAIEDPSLTLKKGDAITLGFDGGKSDDSTALVAVRVSDQAAFLLKIEERPPNWPKAEGSPKWEVNRQAIDSAVHAAFQLYDVKAFFADVAYWESYIADWSEQYGPQLSVKATGEQPIAWDFRSSLQRVTRANERLMQAVLDGKVKTDGNPILRRHALSARRRVNTHGVSFGKRTVDSTEKVDAYAAFVLAFEALNRFRLKDKPSKPERSGVSYFM